MLDDFDDTSSNSSLPPTMLNDVSDDDSSDNDSDNNDTNLINQSYPDLSLQIQPTLSSKIASNRRRKRSQQKHINFSSSTKTLKQCNAIARATSIPKLDHPCTPNHYRMVIDSGTSATMSLHIQFFDSITYFHQNPDDLPQVTMGDDATTIPVVGHGMFLCRHVQVAR